MVRLSSIIHISQQQLEKHTELLIRLIFIGSVLLISLFLSPRIAQNQRYSLLFLLLIFGTVAAIVFLRYPFLGLQSLIIASLVIPFSIGTGSQTNINAGVLLLALLIGLWFFDMIALKHRIWFIPSRTILPLGCFTIICFLSFGIGQLPWLSFVQMAPIRAQIGGLAIFILSFGAFFIAANQIGSSKEMERMVWTFIILGSLYVVGRILPGFGQFINAVYQSGSTGSLFWVWLTVLAFSQILINREITRVWRLSLVVLLIFIFYISLIQEKSWTSGWLPALVSISFVLWLYKPNLRKYMIIGVIVVAALFNSKIIGFLMEGDNLYSLETRFAAWGILARIIKFSPIFGLGPANYYFYTSFFPIMGYSVNFNSHNNYVDIIAQTGFLGLVCFLWFAWEVGRLGWKIKELVPEGFVKAYVYGALGGLVGSMVAGMFGDWILPFVYNVGFDGFRSSILAWLFLGVLVGLEQIYILSNMYNRPITAPK